MTIQKDLDELTSAQVISTETAERIRQYYQERSRHSGNRLFIAFGVLGAILTGLGIILIIAHNWDDLSKNTKVFFSFLPLILAQLFCGFTLLKKSDNMAWREASGAFLFFSTGACISLVSQIYNIHGDLASFLFTWMLLCLPVAYFLRSSMVSLLYIAGITYYCVECNDYIQIFTSKAPQYRYWWMLLLILPFYIDRVRKHSSGNFTTFMHWFVVLSLTIALGSLSYKSGKLMYIAYASMFGGFYLLGSSEFFPGIKSGLNAYRIAGSVGTMHILLTLSFNWYWESLDKTHFAEEQIWTQPEFTAVILCTLFALSALIAFHRKSFSFLQPIKYIFLILLFIFLSGSAYPLLSVALVNLLVLATGVLTIWNGAKSDHLGIMNYGLLSITALIICRFFDSDMSFVVRGLLFVIVGVGFFAANYLMLKKRKQKVIA
jgi:hypothetical protein